MKDTIPEGIKTKALAMGYGVEVKRRATVIAPSLYRFNNRGQAITGWMSIAQAHNWLNSRKETGS